MTSVTRPPSAEHEQPITSMTWHRRRIRRARQRRESAPQPVARVAQEPDTGRTAIRRLVVFVPRTKRAPGTGGDVARAVVPAAAPAPA